MADSSDFADYHLTKWHIDDDSLSYIDHDYWEELINQIVASKWGMKASALSRDRFFRKAFDRVNRPSHDGGSKSKRCSNFSEARRFKLMIASIWNVSAGRDRGCTLHGEGKRRVARDSADKTPRGKDFGNTLCSMPVHTEGFFSFVVETLNVAKEYASNRSQILALRQSLAIDSEKRQSKGTSSFEPKENPSNRKKLGFGQAVSISSNGAGHSREKSSFEANNSLSRQETLIIGDATSFSSDISSHSIKVKPDIDQPMSNSSKRLKNSTVEQSDGDSSAPSPTAFDSSKHSTGLGGVTEPLSTSSNRLGHLAVEQSEVDRLVLMSISPNSSKQPEPLGHSIQSEEVTEPIALALNGLGHSIGSYHPPLVGIDITGHGSRIIKRASLYKRKESLSALGVPLDVVCTQFKDYIVCGLNSWRKGRHVQSQLALEIVGVWFEKSMHQYSSQTLIDFIHELSAGRQLNLGQLHSSAGEFILVAGRMKFDLIPGDAVVANRSVNVSQNSSYQHLLQITNQNVAGKFIGRGGARARETEKILGLFMSLKRFEGKEYFVCRPRPHQNLDRQKNVNRERCRIGLEIISIWLWEHWNAQDDYINLPEFLVCLKASNDKMTLEEIHEAAIHSMRQTRLPYSHKAFFELNYTIEAVSGD
ncbi:hypothetical protein BOTNAR_0017g00030 [Botryotinia narcissicola]|uniref:K Homology domain-containing protein n=1 Tax=Botryotinia narcissicola TaxID=278944 RepID=A0A4Z1JBS1_9HELO|nr:hypothetical protein BOTNAR_0017g00030 [Botryotinia narcissicola]